MFPPKKFVENTKDCEYINITSGKLTYYPKKPPDIERNTLSIYENTKKMKNSKNDQPMIFSLRFNNNDAKCYFCSNIGIICKYLEEKNKKISLFKNNNIKKFFLHSLFKKCNNFDCMFYGCDNIELIFVNDKHSYIDGNSLFEECIKLNEIFQFYYIRNTKKSDFAFKNCKNLSAVHVNSDFILGDYCFENCENLKSVNPDRNYNKFGLYYLPSIVSTGCFKNCSSLEKVSDDLNFVADPKELFYNCKNLKEIKTKIDIYNKDYNYENMFYGAACKKGAEIIFEVNEDANSVIPKEKIIKMFNGCKIPENKINFTVYDTIKKNKYKIQGYKNFLQSKFVSTGDNNLKERSYTKEEAKKNIEDISSVGNPYSDCCCCKCCSTKQN